MTQVNYQPWCQGWKIAEHWLLQVKIAKERALDTSAPLTTDENKAQ